MTQKHPGRFQTDRAVALDALEEIGAALREKRLSLEELIDSGREE
jgi:hypothetical protein